MTGDQLLEALLHPPAPGAFEELRAFWEGHRARTAGLSTIDAALIGGLHADRLGWAFAAGYHAALRALDPELPEGVITALCATESRGVHPRDIETTARLEGGDLVLDGQKAFVTLADEAELLLVVASDRRRPAPPGRNALVVVRVPVSAPGVVREPSERVIPFAPEISHQALRLSGVRVPESAALPGDGYDDALKPFRSLEDVHVFAAGLAYLCGAAGRFRWPEKLRERALAAALALRALADGSRLRSAEAHVALGGALGLGREVIEASAEHWDSAEGAEAARWRRDRSLLDVAGRARAARLEAAWRRLAGR